MIWLCAYLLVGLIFVECVDRHRRRTLSIGSWLWIALAYPLIIVMLMFKPKRRRKL